MSLCHRPAEVEALKRLEQVHRVAHHPGQFGLSESLRTDHGVQLADHRVEVVARDVGHHVVEAFLGQLVLEHQPETIRGFERAALAHDLRQRRPRLERKGLDHHARWNRAPHGFQGGELVATGLREIELCPRSAARQLADDVVAAEQLLACLPSQLRPALRARRARDQVGKPASETVGERVQSEQSQRVRDGHAVEGQHRAHELVLDRSPVVPGCGPAPEQEIDQRERDHQHTRKQGADEADRVEHGALEELDQALEQEPQDPPQPKEDLEDQVDDPADDGCRDREDDQGHQEGRYRGDRAEHLFSFASERRSLPRPGAGRIGGRSRRPLRRSRPLHPCWDSGRARFAQARRFPRA